MQITYVKLQTYKYNCKDTISKINNDSNDYYYSLKRVIKIKK